MRLNIQDLGSGGFGLPWGQSRSYTNKLPNSFNFGNGYNWIMRQQPYLGEKEDGTVFVVRSPSSSRFFAPGGGGTYTALYGVRDTLTYDSGDDKYTYCTPGGTTYVFFGLDSGATSGKIDSFSIPGGDSITFTYTGFQLTEASRTFEIEGSGSSSSSEPGTQTVVRKFVYSYLGGSDPNAGLLKRVVLKEQIESDPEQLIRRVEYSYYDGTNANGSLGDLESALIQSHDGENWLLESIDYYRYYKDSAGGKGFQHGLKYALGGEASARLLVSGIFPQDATDAQLEAVADYHFEYDPTTHAVTKEIVDGKARRYTFSYTERTSTPVEDYNVWQTKTVENQLDAIDQVIRSTTVYTNYLGQVMLRELKQGTNVWYHYYEYSNEGRLALRATPSAVASYNDALPDLDVMLNSSSGLIHTFVYYTTDSSTAAKGYVHYESIKVGSSGQESKLKEYEYGQVTVGQVVLRPVTKETAYRSEGDADPVATEFTNTYYSGTAQRQERKTKLPKVPASQNGNNAQAEVWEYYDENGNRIAVKDERDYVTTYKYNLEYMAVEQMVEDASTGLPGDWSNTLPLPGSHFNLTTDYTYDSEGRQIETLGPAHDVDGNTVRTASWTVYSEGFTLFQNTFADETWTTSGYLEGTTYKVTNPPAPVNISISDKGGRSIATIVSERDPNRTSAKLSLSENYIAQSRWARWSGSIYDDKSRLGVSRLYHDIPISGSGTLGTNYVDTNYVYDEYDRQDGVRTPGGTITRTVFDIRNQSIESWTGTNDNGFGTNNFDSTGTSNMVKVSSNVYDSGNDKGDGLLTKQTAHVDAVTANDRETEFRYDGRDRQEKTIGEEDLFQRNYYDNLSRVTKVEFNDGAGGAGNPGGTLINRSETFFDDRGRTYQQKRYAVNPSTGTVGSNPLTDNTWYDLGGNAIKAASAGSNAWTKTVYDGLGRSATDYAGYGSTDPFAANPVASDIIFEQTDTTYNDANEVTYALTKRRYDDAPASGTGSTGPLTDPSGANPKSRNMHMAFWFDEIGRSVASADYGSDSTTRPSTPPSSSATVHVTSSAYNDRGEAYQTTDAAGTVSESTFSDAGRLTKQVNNVVTSPSTWDEDQTVEYEYNADGQITKLTAVNADTGNQETIYTYGVTTSDSALTSNNLLHTVEYPASGAGELVTTEYNRQGQVIQMTDQNGTVHDNTFDGRGRPTADQVSTVGTGIDNAVLRIERSYEVRGMMATVTSYDAATAGTVVNEVAMVYNDFSQLTDDKQEHSGVVTGSSPKVQYAYADGSDNTIRQTSMSYPDTTVLEYNYGTTGSTDDELSRTSALKVTGESDDLVEYTYLGAGTIVKADYVQPDVRYDLATGSGATRYAGLDSFDRTTTCLWEEYGTPADLVKLNYTYDQVNNRTSREDVISKAQTTPIYLDQAYAYDGLHRLVDMEQGELSSGSITNPNFRQNWEKPSTSPAETSLDPTGNWSRFRQDDNGGGSTWELDQTRGHNEVNEITSITGGSWVAPAYDAAGNQTAIPWPLAMSLGLTAKYDAWNRLAVATTPFGPITYEYDGLNRRTIKSLSTETRHYYYSESWQTLEERTGTSTTAERQHIWGLRYIDDLIRRNKDTETLYGLQDDNWNMVAATNASGVVQERYTYDAYGDFTLRNADFSTKNDSPLLENLYASYLLDFGTLLYYVRNRHYHQKLGRWVTRDPIEQEQIGSLSGAMGQFFSEENLYLYAGDSPLAGVDPGGLFTAPPECFTPCMQCGPEVGRALELTLLNARRRLMNISWYAKRRAQLKILLLRASDWDIMRLRELDSKGPCWKNRIGTVCRPCVEVFGVKQDTWEVNYALWGMMTAAIGITYLDAIGIAATYKVYKWAFEKKDEKCRPNFQVTGTLTQWIKTGYRMYDPWFWQSPSGVFHSLRPKNNNLRFLNCGPCGVTESGPFSYNLIDHLD